MTSIKVSKTSRYVGTDLYRVSDSFGYPTNNFYFGVWRRPVIDVESDDQSVSHTVQEHELGRLDLLAHRYYGDPLLWWVIADANHIIDQFTEINAGDVIIIPSIDVVTGAMEAARGR